MAAADDYYTTRTPPGSPGWLPSIPGPAEWPLLEDVAAEYLARFLDSKLAEIAINQDLMNGQLEMAFVRRPQTYVRRANGGLGRDVPIGPLPEGSERVILPAKVTYGRVLDWVTSKFYVMPMMPDGTCKVIRPNAASLPGIWHFFARRAPVTAPVAETKSSGEPPSKDAASPDDRHARRQKKRGKKGPQWARDAAQWLKEKGKLSTEAEGQDVLAGLITERMVAEADNDRTLGVPLAFETVRSRLKEWGLWPPHLI